MRLPLGRSDFSRSLVKARRGEIVLRRAATRPLHQQLGCLGTHRAVCSGEKKRLARFIYPGKTSSGSTEQREEVSRAAEGPALRSEQGQRRLPAQPSARSPWGGRAARREQPPPRDLLSLLPPQRPGRSRAAPAERPKVTETRVAAAGRAPCRGAQGRPCPPGSPGPRCGNQVRPGPPRLPRDPLTSLVLPSAGTGCFIPWDCAALPSQVTWDPALILLEISCYLNTSVGGWAASAFPCPARNSLGIPILQFKPSWRGTGLDRVLMQFLQINMGG